MRPSFWPLMKYLACSEKERALDLVTPISAVDAVATMAPRLFSKFKTYSCVTTA